MSRSQNQVPLRQPEREPSPGLPRSDEQSPQMTAARQWITNEMRRLYNDVVNEPLPASFKDLIDQLEVAEEPDKRTGEKNAAS